MLIAFLIFASIVAVVFLLFGMAIGNTGREQLRNEIASLKERLIASDARYQESRRITGELLEVVREKVGLKPSASRNPFGEIDAPVPSFNFERVAPNINLPEVKTCPECSVSVRSEEWPQECPACHCLFGFKE